MRRTTSTKRTVGRSFQPTLRRRASCGSRWLQPNSKPFPARLTRPHVRSRALQLDSFDDFICNQVQEIVDEQPKLELVPQQQHNPTMQQRGDVSYLITFGQIYLSKPTWTEPDQTTSAMFPNEARLRNLT